MSKRLLFCVETTQQANTDYPYILETIRHYYGESRKIVLRPIYMGSKTKYNSKSVKEDIKRQSGTAETHVIYCIDTDDYDISADTEATLKQIQRYCENNGYDFIFFCKNIEEVYHEKTVPDTGKIAAIKYFKSSHAIKNVKTANLQRENYQIHCSNILNILDKYLKRIRS